MAELPSGTVTFLFTDLEVSTRLWEEHPEEMKVALARHDELVRSAIESHRGYVVKTTGDGVHAVFTTAQDGIGAAVAVQRALAIEDFGALGELRVRIGIHTGSADVREGDYYGTAVNRTARLMSVAHGGQIVCSQATADLARDALPQEVTLIDLGEHRLRDLSRPERVFEVRAPGLSGGFAPLASIDAFPGNLPLRVSSFIGREVELERVTRAVEAARVVTLTGVGGVGKTRLALQAAGELLPSFREGAWLCELAGIRDPDGVTSAFAAVFSVTARDGQTLAESLVEFLQTKRLLLVVDNCEHLLEAVADVVELLERSCPGVVVLATSREGLALEGEQVVPVPSLPSPPAGANIETATRADAVRLFVERAHGVDPDFVLTPDNAAPVVQVCRRLDGVPLAIELAAARITTMSPSELARGLDRRFETLAGGRRRAVQRHQTLRAAIDWSYELLSDGERRLLARLSVFAGGLTRAAAEHVCAADPLEGPAVFELLAGLVTRSLVEADRERPETRYRLLETIREYGEDRLAEAGETDLLRARHAAYYTQLATELSADIVGPQQIEAGRRLIAEHENVLAAMNYLLDTDNADLALRLLYATPPPSNQVGYELQLPIESILELTGAREHPLYPYGLARAAMRVSQRGDIALSSKLCEDALAAQRLASNDDPYVEVVVLNARSAICYANGAVHDAALLLDEAVDLVRPLGDVEWLGFALNAAATFHVMAGEAELAAPLAAEGLAIARRLDVPTLIASNLAALAGALADQDPEQARSLLSESIALRASLNYENWGELTQAVLISARLRDWPLTLELASPAIRHLHWVGNGPLLAAVFNLVACAVVESAPDRAAVLLGAARGLTPVFGTPRETRDTTDTARTANVPRANSVVTELRREATTNLRDALDEQRLRSLRAEGEAMGIDDAVAYAMDTITRVRPDLRK